LEPVDDQEVTGVIVLDDKRLIITVGWSRKIVKYSDIQSDTVIVKANNNWRGGQQHQEDILAVAYCPPNLLATASFDGEIFVWSLETEMLFKQLKKMPVRQRSARKATPNSRPTSRHWNSHKLPDGQPVPVDKLLFLQARAKSKHLDSAILVSSEAGVLRWWSIYAKQPEFGHFNIFDTPDESILGLCTTTDNELLMCGDTRGFISVYNIANYCIHQFTETQPELKWSWPAHSAAIVSIDCIDNIASQSYIVSASVDMTARLWTVSGIAIGIFGQANVWSLTDSTTWQSSEQNDANSYDAEQVSATDLCEPDSQKAKEQKTNGLSTNDVQSATLLPKINLGVKFKDHLMRIKQDRQGRRSHLYDIDFSPTNRSKTLCCPFQAVATSTLASVSVPIDIPHAIQRRHATPDVTKHTDLSSVESAAANVSLIPHKTSTIFSSGANTGPLPPISESFDVSARQSFLKAVTSSATVNTVHVF
jgi:WD40 repeat protein